MTPKKYQPTWKILAPVTRVSDIPALKKAGAQELYCGYISKKLSAKWPPAFNLLNRRGDQGNITDRDEFKKLADEAARQSMPLYITVNGLYTPEQYPALREMIRDIAEMPGVTGIIVADMGLLLTLKKSGFKKEIHVGTGGTTFNGATADLYAGLGASRVVFDRQLTAAEIKAAVDGISSDIGTEIFVLREGCGGFIDGFCTFLHCFETPNRETVDNKIFGTSYNTSFVKGCYQFVSGRTSGIFSVATSKPTGRRLQYTFNHNDFTGCRLCDLYDLQASGITALKIVGRGADPGLIVTPIAVVAQALSWLRQGALTRKEYTARCRKLFAVSCNNGRPCSRFSCYFSSRWVSR